MTANESSGNLRMVLCYVSIREARENVLSIDFVPKVNLVDPARGVRIRSKHTIARSTRLEALDGQDLDSTGGATLQENSRCSFG